MNDCPSCPLCGSSEQVERIDPPKHNPAAVFHCAPCNRAYTGTAMERANLQAERAAKWAERDEMARRKQAGIDRGVLGGEA